MDTLAHGTFLFLAVFNINFACLFVYFLCYFLIFHYVTPMDSLIGLGCICNLTILTSRNYQNMSSNKNKDIVTNKRRTESIFSIKTFFVWYKESSITVIFDDISRKKKVPPLMTRPLRRKGGGGGAP